MDPSQDLLNHKLWGCSILGMGILTLWLRTADLAGWLRDLLSGTSHFNEVMLPFLQCPRVKNQLGLPVASNYPIITFYRGMICLPLFFFYSNLISRAHFGPCCAHDFHNISSKHRSSPPLMSQTYNMNPLECFQKPQITIECDRGNLQQNV